jgi:hypothetical protein
MAKKNYKKTPKTNVGDIIEGFGFSGGPRGKSASKNKTVGSVTGQKTDNMDFLFDDISKIHFPKGKLNRINIKKWQGELGPPKNPMPSSHHRKVANIKLNKMKVNKK